MPALASGHREPLALPVDMVERHRRDLAAAQAVGREQQQGGVVPLAAGRAPIDTGEHLADLRGRDRSRDVAEPVGPRPIDRLAQVADEHALAIRVAQEPAQRPTQQPDARLGQAAPRALRDKRADQRRRELDQLCDPDLSEILLEAPQIAPVAVEGGRAKPALTQQVLEEPRQLVAERHPEQHTAASREPGNNKTKHLLDRHMDVLDALTRGHRTELSSAIRRDPLGDECLDIRREIADGPGTGSACELAEGEQHRHTTAHARAAIALLGQPNDVALDLRTDPRRPDAIDRLRPDVVALQHEGQAPLR